MIPQLRQAFGRARPQSRCPSHVGRGPAYRFNRPEGRFHPPRVSRLPHCPKTNYPSTTGSSFQKSSCGPLSEWI